MVNDLWRTFAEYIKLFYVNFDLSKEKVLLGYDQESLFLNLLIVIVKNYIYKCKFKEVIPNIIGIKNIIKKYQSIDFYNSRKNNKFEACEHFWAPLQEIFP